MLSLNKNSQESLKHSYKEIWEGQHQTFVGNQLKAILLISAVKEYAASNRDNRLDKKEL